MLSALSDNEQEIKYQAVQNLCDASVALINLLASEDRPSWLNSIHNSTHSYLAKNTSPDSVISGSNWALSQEAWGIYKTAMNHSWDFTKLETQEFDFDKIYNKYRENSNITDLFDSLIEILNQMVESGELDSVKAINAFNELIATLSQNKNSSYFSTMTTWNFLKSFIHNYAWEQVNNIPGIKSLKKAFEKTVSEMDMELEKLHEEIKEEMRQKYKITVQSALTYAGSKQLKLGSPKNK